VDCAHMLDIDLEAAGNYKLGALSNTQAFLDACRHNSELARSIGRSTEAKAWKLLQLSVGSYLTRTPRMNWKGHPLGEELLCRMLRACIDERQTQSVSVMLAAVEAVEHWMRKSSPGEQCNLLSARDPAMPLPVRETCQKSQDVYVLVCRGRGLHTCATELLGCRPAEARSKQPPNRSCLICGAELPENSLWCAACKVFASSCSVCRLPARGLYYVRNEAGAIAHLQCI